MELFLPDQIVLNEVSLALLADVEETARRVNEYRPLPEEVTKRILDDLLGERVYASNAIEGNTLDLRETVTILKTGRLLESRRREAIEARSLGQAVNAGSGLVPLGAGARTVEHLLEIHRLILWETPDEYWGGRFRGPGVMIDGAKYQPPDHTLVPTLVDRAMEHLRRGHEGVSPLLLACWAHWSLARIHPFKDGNGRTARLWQDLVLFQGNLTAAIIRPEERREYLDALTAADEGDFNALVQLIASRVLTTFDMYLVEIAQARDLDVFVQELTGVLDTRTGEKEQLAYQRWARKMEQLLWEFEVCAARITEASDWIRLRIERHPVIGAEKWANIRLGLSPEAPVFFALTAIVQGRERSFEFVFRKLGGSPSVPGPDDMMQAVSLGGMQKARAQDSTQTMIVSGSTTVMYPRSADSADSWIGEAVVLDNGFRIGMSNADTSGVVFNSPVAATRVAQEFLREVVLRRLT